MLAEIISGSSDSELYRERSRKYADASYDEVYM